MRRLSILLMVTLAICVPASAITGKVVDDKGKPVAGAKVFVDCSYTAEQVFHADEKGEFVYFRHANPDGMTTTVTIKVVDSKGNPVPGAQAAMFKRIDPFMDSDVPDVTQTDASGSFVYQTPEPFKGVIRVRDSGGASVARAKLISTQINPARTSETDLDEKGEFAFPSGEVNPSESTIVSLRVVADGLTFGEGSFDRTKPKPVTITLWPEQLVKLKVVGEDGQPLSGISVYYTAGFSLKSGARRRVWASSPTITSDTDGGFELRHIPSKEIAGEIGVSLTLDGPGRARTEKHFENVDLQKVGNIVLPREVVIKGVVYPPGKTGSLPPGLRVTLTVPDEHTRALAHATAEVATDGSFKFDKLPAGTVDVRLSSRRVKSPLEWTVPAVRNLRLTSGDVKNLELVGVTGSLISGVVTDKTTGNPIRAGLSVMHEGNPEGDGVRTDKDGKFSTRVAAGNVTVRADMIMVGDQTIDYDQKDRPSISVQVTDGQDKSGVDMAISPPVKHEDDNEESEAPTPEEKKIPAGFELKPGTYELKWDPTFDIDVNYTLGDNSVDAKKLIKRNPLLISKKPIYAALRLDGRGTSGVMLAVMDESKGTGKGYDTIYADTNRNFDLSDEKAMKLALKDGEKVTPWFAVMSHQGLLAGEHTTNPLTVELVCMPQGPQKNEIHVRRKGAWVGVVESTSGKVQFAQIDADGNGVYSDKLNVKGWDYSKNEDGPFGDFAFVDATGSGKAVANESIPGEICLGVASMLGDKLYDVRPNDVGNKVTIAPYGGPTGQVQPTCHDVNGVAGTVTEFGLAGKVGFFWIRDWDGKPITVPAGPYVFFGMHVDVQAKSPNQSFECVFLPGPTVVEGKMTNITLAGPVSSSISPQEKKLVLRTGVREKVSLVIKIGSKAMLTSFDTPTVRFYDQKGRPAGTAITDWGGNSYTAVVVPKLKPGRYTIQMSANTSSPLGIISAKRQVTVVK